MVGCHLAHSYPKKKSVCVKASLSVCLSQEHRVIFKHTQKNNSRMTLASSIKAQSLRSFLRRWLDVYKTGFKSQLHSFNNAELNDKN